MATQTHSITVAQYEHSFDGYPGLRDELINGRIVMNPQPKPLHQQIRKNIERLLDAACERTDYTANSDSNIQFPASDSAPAPDVFVVESSRWQEAMRKGTYIDSPPLLVVEILSPSQDVAEKINLYSEAGVAAIWVVDPKRRNVLVHTGREMRQYGEHAEIALPLPLNGSVKIDDIFFALPKFALDD
jgi:Uma2 family endonuclease